MGELGVFFGALFLVIAVILVVFVGFYIIVSIPLHLYLKKSNIPNAWLAYVPLANSYKLTHYMYDFFYSDKVINKEVSSEEYISKRRMFSVWVTLGFIGVGFILGIIAAMFAPAIDYGSEVGYQTTVAYETTAGEGVVNLITILISIVYSVLIYAGMFSMVYYLDVKERMSKGKVWLFTILTIITGGLSWVIQFYYYSFSDKHGYYLNQYLHPELENNQGLSREEDLRESNVEQSNVIVRDIEEDNINEEPK